MAIKLTLSSQKIYEKVFPSSDKGYDPLSVDEFLDQVIKDYLAMESGSPIESKEADALKKRIAELENKVTNLEIENEKYKTRFANIKESDNVTSDNIELVKKINRYEKFLYNHGYNPQTIK